MIATGHYMNRTKERTKREKVLVTLPDNYLTALDNKIDNILIRTRGDAVIALLTELQKARPDALEFEEMVYIKHAEYLKVLNELDNIKTLQSKPILAPLPAWISNRMWLTEKTLNDLVAMLKIADDANDTSAMITISGIDSKVKKADSISHEEWMDVRKRRAAKKAEAEGAPA